MQRKNNWTRRDRNVCKDYFAETARLKESKAWNIFAKYGWHVKYEKHLLFNGITGADHTCVWQRNKKYLITTEPYSSDQRNIESLLSYSKKYGWTILLSDYPGWWNPPSTELWMLSPPKIGIDPYEVDISLTLQFKYWPFELL